MAIGKPHNDNTQQQSARCEQCGETLGHLTNSETICPSCLLSTAIKELQPEDHFSLHSLSEKNRSPSIADLNRSLPQYKFIELLGRGGSGWVYLAKQRSLNRPVAIKLLRHTSKYSSIHMRFTKEAQMLANLNSPRLVTVHDYGPSNQDPWADDSSEEETNHNYYYLVMEYVAGPTLRKKMQAGTLSPAATIRIAKQVCQAISYAHARDIVHRDLKPENILFVSDREDADLKVADFGIAKLLGQAEPATSYTVTGTVVGTPYYMAPERHLANTEANPQSDIFSLGVILYEMLTGQVPIGHFSPPAISHSTPIALSNTVMRALASNPDDRFSSAGAMLEALQGTSPNQAITTSSRKNKNNLAVRLSLVSLVILGGIWISTLFLKTPDTSLNANREVVAEETTTLPNQLASSSEASTNPPVKESSVQEEEQQTSDELDNSEEALVTRVYAVKISNVQIRHLPAFEAQLRFDLQFYDDTKAVQHEDSTLFWIYRDSRGNPTEKAIPPREGRKEISIDDRIDHRPGSGLWPGEIYIEERWGDSLDARRRVSDVFNVQGWHTHIRPF